MKDLVERIAGAGHDPDSVVKFVDPSFDDAVVGITSDGRLVYDYDAMVRLLAAHDGMDEEAAAEFIDYNTVRSLPYVQDGPIVFRRFEEDGDE